MIIISSLFLGIRHTNYFAVCRRYLSKDIRISKKDSIAPFFRKFLLKIFTAESRFIMSYTIEDLFIGKIARMQRIFTDEEVKVCEKLTRDNSPVYNVEDDIWKHHYHQPIVPGLLAEGLINQVISEKLPGVACVLLQKELIFYLPVYVGDIITAELEIIDINMERNWVTQKVACFNQNGSEVIKGQVVVVILTNQN